MQPLLNIKVAFVTFKVTLYFMKNLHFNIAIAFRNTNKYLFFRNGYLAKLRLIF